MLIILNMKKKGTKNKLFTIRSPDITAIKILENSTFIV